MLKINLNREQVTWLDIKNSFLVLNDKFDFSKKNLYTAEYQTYFYSNIAA